MTPVDVIGWATAAAAVTFAIGLALSVVAAVVDYIRDKGKR